MMLVQVVLSAIFLAETVRGQSFGGGGGKAPLVCQANYPNKCCLSAYWPNGKCDDLILETTISAAEGQSLTLQADPRIDWTQGPNSLGSCTWNLPSGLACSFVVNALETTCRGAPEVRWAGDFRSGRCHITVDNVDSQKHFGNWRCSINVASTFTDEVRVEVTSGMPASKALAISLPIVAIVAAVLIVACVCIFFPTLCLSCACLMCAPCRERAEREQRIRKEKNKANRPLPNINAMEAGHAEVIVPLRGAAADNSSSTNTYANDSLDTRYRDDDSFSGGRIVKGANDGGVGEGDMYDAVQYTHAAMVRPNFEVAGGGQTKTARKISNPSFAMQPHHEGMTSTIQ